jgi:hypothetical protein
VQCVLNDHQHYVTVARVDRNDGRSVELVPCCVQSVAWVVTDRTLGDTKANATDFNLSSGIILENGGLFRTAVAGRHFAFGYP